MSSILTVYKIRDKATGLYYTGLSDSGPYFSAMGKVYTNMFVAKATRLSLSFGNENEQLLYSTHNVEVVEFTLTESGIV